MVLVMGDGKLEVKLMDFEGVEVGGRGGEVCANVCQCVNVRSKARCVDPFFDCSTR